MLFGERLQVDNGKLQFIFDRFGMMQRTIWSNIIGICVALADVQVPELVTCQILVAETTQSVAAGVMILGSRQPLRRNVQVVEW